MVEVNDKEWNYIFNCSEEFGIEDIEKLTTVVSEYVKYDNGEALQDFQYDKWFERLIDFL